MAPSSPETKLRVLELAWTLEPGGTLTGEERETLSSFMGWGGLAPAFAALPTGRWLTIADRLDERIPAAALEVASEQVDTSFFTPAEATDAVWELLRATGFTGGQCIHRATRAYRADVLPVQVM